MKKIKDVLPAKFSDVIKLAVKDMDIMQAKGAKIHMSDWVVKDIKTDKVCTVCMAGAVMANLEDKGQAQLEYQDKSRYNHTLGYYVSPIKKSADPEDARLSQNDKNKLNALNEIRKGNIGEALECLGFADNEIDEVVKKFDLGNYDTAIVRDPRYNKELFKINMELMANLLADEGL